MSNAEDTANTSSPIPQVSNSTPLSQHALPQPLNASVSLQSTSSPGVRTRRIQHTDKQRGGLQPSQSDTTQSMLQRYISQEREKDIDAATSVIDEDDLSPVTKEKLQNLERELKAYKSYAPFTGSPPLKRTDKLNNRNSTGDPLPTPTSSTILPPPATSSLLPPPPPQSTTPTKRRSKVPNTDRRNNDIEFATEIGQGLLLEVRKMQSLLQEKEEQLRRLETDKAESERLAEVLAKQLKQSQESEEHLKEDAWNLELAKQELGNTMTELQHSLSKSVTDQNKMSKQLTSLTQEVEVLRSTEEKLTSQVETMKVRHEQDMSAMRKHSSTLQREKNDIAKQLETTVAELTTARTSLSKSKRKSITDADISGTGDGANANGSDDDVNGKQNGHSPNTSPPPSPTHAPRNTALELETLKTSLSHAHRMISNLRSSLHKEKQDRFELKKHLADSQETIEQLRNGSHMWADVGAERASGSGYGPGEGAIGSHSASGRRLKKAGNKKRAPARRAKGLTPRRPSDDDEEYEDIDDIEILNTDNSEDDYEDHPDKLHRDYDSSGGLTETTDSDSIHTIDGKPSLGLTQAKLVPLSSELSGSKNYNPGVDMGVNTDPIAFVSESLPAEQPKVMQVDTGVNTEAFDATLFPTAALTGLSAAAGLVAGGLTAHEIAKHDELNTIPITSAQAREPEVMVKSAVTPVEQEQNGVVDEIVTHELDKHDEATPIAADVSTQASEPEVVDKSIVVPAELGQNEIVDDVAALDLNTKTSTDAVVPITVDTSSSTVDTVTPGKSTHISETVTAQFTDRTAHAEPTAASAIESDDKVVAQPEEALSAVSTLAILEVANDVSAQSDNQSIEKDAMKPDTVTALAGGVAAAVAEQSTADVFETNGYEPASTGDATDDLVATKVVEKTPILVDAATQTTPDDVPSERDNIKPLALPVSGDLAADQVTEEKSIPTDYAATSVTADIPSDAAVGVTALAASVVGAGVAREIFENKSSPVDTATIDEVASPDQAVSAPLGESTQTVDSAPRQQYEDSAEVTSKAFTAKQIVPTATTDGPMTNSASDILPEDSLHVAASGEESDVMMPASATVADQEIATNNVTTSHVSKQTHSEFQSKAPAQDTSSKLVEAAALTGGIAALGMSEKMAEYHSLLTHNVAVNQETPLKVDETSPETGAPVMESVKIAEPSQERDLGHATIFNTSYPTNKLTQKNLAALSATPDGNDITAVSKREFDNISRSDIGSGSRRASSSIYKPISEKEGYSSTIAPNIVSNITQTMIGGWMYKNTRKTVGSGFSDNRHSRFFWIHPYSRTLYWSMKEPGSNGEAKAKSVTIESITSVPEHSNSPPGLPSVSLLVKTSTREIKFTAPDVAQHEIWLQAINYLLSRPSGNFMGMSQLRQEPQSLRSNPSIVLRKASFQRLQGVFSSASSNAPSKTDSARYAGDGLNDEDLEDLEDVRMCCDGKHHISKLEKNHSHPHRSSRQYRPVSGVSFDQPIAMSITSGNGSIN
ncbi:hypothetical protein BGW37DRAFT_517825 [Umbelopsis sp. PMI_123]|nr:hypothetical protein BGW37DRAFT_517825 [Umbelopsis sp. PMI_123]